MGLLASALLSACEQKSAGDNVRQAYDNKADAVEQQGAAQPTDAAKKIYKARADALRDEGKDREAGLEGGSPTAGHKTAAGEGASAGTPSPASQTTQQ